VAVGVEAQAAPEARFGPELIHWRAFQKSDEPAMRVLQFPEHAGEWQSRLSLRHLSIECVDAAVRDGVSRRLLTFEKKRKMLQRLLFPSVT
jgi:hypothetical protein